MSTSVETPASTSGNTLVSATVNVGHPAVPHAGARSQSGMSTAQRVTVSSGAVALVLGVWQLSGTLQWIDPLLLPPPTEIISTTADILANGYRQVSLWQHIWVSVLRATVAFVAAIAAGIPLGLAMGLSQPVSAVLEPFVQFLRPLPKIALIPLTVVWFGIDEGSKFFLIFISCFLSVVVSAAAAAVGVNKNRLRAAQTLGANRYQLFTRVVLPNALPEIFTGVRLSIGIGWTSLIAAEMVAANSGLGWMVINAGTYLRTDVVMLGILLLGGIGYLFDLALVLLQRAVVPWAGRDT